MYVFISKKLRSSAVLALKYIEYGYYYPNRNKRIDTFITTNFSSLSDFYVKIAMNMFLLQLEKSLMLFISLWGYRLDVFIACLILSLFLVLPFVFNPELFSVESNMLFQWPS